ncbi:MAG: IclR family transcriptional regulator [Acidimicrobiales bacterium]|jgi:IclR family acetate operon transcriptional repressor
MRPDSGAPSERLVQSVDRALRLVELLSERSGDMGLSELAAAADLPQGTTHRILRTLSNRGWVRRSGERRYAPGTTLIRFSSVAQRALAIAAEPYLEELVALSGESANLAVLEGDHAVYLAQVPSPHRLRTFAEVGHRIPLHSTGVGKVLLANLATEQADVILAQTGLPTRTPRTITDLETLRSELARIRETGVAIDDGEEDMGVRCVAISVTDLRGKLPAAISVSGPANRLDELDTDVLALQMHAIIDRFARSLF